VVKNKKENNNIDNAAWMGANKPTCLVKGYLLDWDQCLVRDNRAFDIADWPH
jgi:hypothetical protein